MRYRTYLPRSFQPSIHRFNIVTWFVYLGLGVLEGWVLSKSSRVLIAIIRDFELWLRVTEITNLA